MAALRITLNQTYQKGNTLVHYLAMWGDECAEVLQYLVRVRTASDKPALDLNVLNHMGNNSESSRKIEASHQSPSESALLIGWVDVLEGVVAHNY